MSDKTPRTDLIERLRANVSPQWDRRDNVFYVLPDPLTTEAAARIAELERELAAQDVQMNAVRHRAEQAEEEIKRARSADAASTMRLELALAALRSENEAYQIILNLCTEQVGIDTPYGDIPGAIAAMRVEAERDPKDAGRYRWIRTNAGNMEIMPSIENLDALCRKENRHPTPEEIDIAIDAATSECHQ